MKKTVILAAAALMLSGCGKNTEENEMTYVKTSVLYDTLYDMYENPDDYLGKMYHITGQLYPSYDDDNKLFYSVYTESSDGHALGLELDWLDYSGLSDYDTITVEGTLDKATQTHDGEESEYLILRVTSLEKRDDKK